MKIVIFRPQPGADETAARARAIGFHPILSPLFEIRPVDWEKTNASVDAIMITSANALLQAGPPLNDYLGLPCYTVGERTAMAATRAGFQRVRTGETDVAALLGLMASEGVFSALHLCGHDHNAATHPNIRIERRVVYAAEPTAGLASEAVEAISAGCIALIHSPRAGQRFSSLIDQSSLRRNRVTIAAISEAAASQAGTGWRSVHVAKRPADEALLELARKLCNKCNEIGFGKDE